MARLETWYKQDLKKPLIVHKHSDVFNQDNRGNLIGIEVYSNGEPVTLAGSVSGYCLLADGTTVPAVGASRSGNKASVLIPQTAYGVPGPITITIKNVEGNDITTLCAVVGLVRQSVSGNLVNPGSVVTDWSNSINAQLQAVQTAADNVGAIVAAPFDENTVYVVGNYVTNNGNLYEITGNHAAGVAWADTAKTQRTVGSELSDLKSANNNKAYGEAIGYVPSDLMISQDAFVDGGFNTSGGNYGPASDTAYLSTHKRINDYFALQQDRDYTIVAADGYIVMMCLYDVDKTFIERSTTDQKVTIPAGKASYIRLGVYSDKAFDKSDAYKYLFATFGDLISVDPSLSTAGMAADAKATGDAVSSLNSALNETNKTVSDVTGSFNDSLVSIYTVLNAQEANTDITSSLQWIESKMLNVVTGRVDNYSGLSYAIVGFARKGDKYNIQNLRGMGTSRAITLIGANGIVDNKFTVLATMPETAGYFSGDYTVPDNGILVVTVQTVNISIVKVQKAIKTYDTVATAEEVETIEEYIDFVSPALNLIDTNNLTSGYLNGQGGINAASGTTQEKTSQVIPINTNHTYKFLCDVPSATGTSWLAVGFWDANDTFLGRRSATVTTVDNISHAELTFLPKDYIEYANAAYMRVSWRSYGTQMATANDFTSEDKTIFEIIDKRQSGADKTYKINGGRIDVGRSGFNVIQLGFAPREESEKYTQGMAVSNGVIFQGYGDGSIDLIDLQTGALINSYAANGGHCGSLSFSNVYQEGNTEFPLLYVSSFNENKTFVYSITRTECVLVDTYLIPRIAGYCQETCIDRVTGVLWCVGHKVNSYSSGGGLIVSAWDLSNVTEEGGILTPTEIMHYDLPWVQYLQAVQVLNGQLFAVFGADGGTAGLLTHIMVSNLGMNIWKSEIADFPSAILSAEPEGLDFVYNNSTFKYDAILATRRSIHYYRVEF